MQLVWRGLDSFWTVVLALKMWLFVDICLSEELLSSREKSSNGSLSISTRYVYSAFFPHLPHEHKHNTHTRRRNNMSISVSIAQQT